MAAPAITFGRRFHVVALGEAMVEFNQTEAGSSLFVQGFGGDTSNAAIAAARAGCQVAYLTRIADDPFGQALLALWQSEGVGVEAVEIELGTPQNPASTGIYFVTHHAQGGHQFTYKRSGSSASRMTPDYLALTSRSKTIADASILHVSAISQAISESARLTVDAALTIAKAHGTLISYDTNLRLRLWDLPVARATIIATIAKSDVFLPSQDDLTALLPLDLNAPGWIRWSHEHGAKLVCLKMGQQGVLFSDGVSTTQISGVQVTAIDATGAGDCFAGNFLARIARGDTALDALRYANCAAGLSVTGTGAVAPLPRPEAVYQTMAANRSS